MDVLGILMWFGIVLQLLSLLHIGCIIINHLKIISEKIQQIEIEKGINQQNLKTSFEKFNKKAE